MTPTDQAPREFWVGISDGNVAHVHSEQKWATDYCLIEKKHFAALQEENRKLKEAYGLLRDALVYVHRKIGHCPFSIDDRWGDVLETSYKTSKRAIARAEEVLK